MRGLFLCCKRGELIQVQRVINLLCIEPFKENIENMYSLPVFYLFTKSKKQRDIQYAGAGTASFGVLMSQKTLKGSSSLSNFIYTSI